METKSFQGSLESFRRTIVDKIGVPATAALEYMVRTLVEAALDERSTSEGQKDDDAQGYSFSASEKVVLGKACAVRIREWPMVSIQPRRAYCNAPASGMFTVMGWSVDGVALSPTYDRESEKYYKTPDAHDFKDGIVLNEYDCACHHGMEVLVNYTGFVPTNFHAGDEFLFTATLQGRRVASARVARGSR